MVTQAMPNVEAPSFFFEPYVQGLSGEAVQPNFFTQKVAVKGYVKELCDIGTFRLKAPSKKEALYLVDAIKTKEYKLIHNSRLTRA